MLDESTDGLDPQTRIERYQLIRREANDRDISVLGATHMRSDIERMADDIYILHCNSMLLQSGLEELREQLWVIECDPIAPNDWLPSGVEMVQTKSSIIGQNEMMLRNPTAS